MKRSSLLLAAGTLLTALAVAVPARAQDTTRKQSTGEVAAMPTYATLTAALESIPANIEKLASRTDIAAADIRLVDADLLSMGKDTEFKAALASHAAHLTSLRDAVGRNTVITGALSTNEPKLMAADVVALQVNDSGEVVVFYHKTM
jgi:hypothetical protein